jgi:D-glycero-alpha-D-manno-heptose-7-phosphate kinase
MVITQTPLRISFLGGGSDYPDYYLRHGGGATLVVSINQYTIITVHHLTRFADHALRVHYSSVETVKSLDEVKHPSARECLRFLGIDRGVEIHYVTNLPARTGLGSSSSATVGLLHALHAFQHKMVSCEQLAAEAVHVEQKLIKERVGSQDQYACAYGGLRHLEFLADGTVHATPLILAPDRLQALNDRLLLFYTGIQRHAHDILEEQIERTVSGVNTQQLDRIKSLVAQGVQVLAEGKDLAQFGELLHDSWTIKRGLSSKITSPGIDDAYARARQAGAIGGKLLGAGGGGFLLLYAEPEHHQHIHKALPDLRSVPFSFENLGSQTIFYRP